MGRSPCCSKEKELYRGAWSALEDKILSDYIKLHGEGKWRSLANRAGLKRCGKSCRLRWVNYLRPNIKRGDISQGEEDLIIRLHKLLGNKWSLIAGRLPGRTDNEIKNYWNTTLRKKIKGTFSLELHGNLQKHITQQSAQVVLPKASRCTKALAPPLEVENFTKNGAGGPIAGEFSATTKVKSLTQNAADEPPIAGGFVIQNSKQLETIELSTLTSEDDDLLNSLMDFDVDELCLSSILDSKYLHNGNDATQYDRNPTLEDVNGFIFPDGSNEMTKDLTNSDCMKNNLYIDVQSSVSLFYSEEECVGDYLQLGYQ